MRKPRLASAVPLINVRGPYLPISYRKQHGRATAAHRPGGEEEICVIYNWCNILLKWEKKHFEVSLPSTY